MARHGEKGLERRAKEGVSTCTPRGVMSSSAASFLRRDAFGFVSYLYTPSRTLSWARVVRFLCLTSLGV